MMRLPPTGISISQSDLSESLKQLEIYEGLLKQGFKKAEVATYFRKHRTDIRTSRNISLLPEPGPAPSTVSLQQRRREKAVFTSMQSQAEDVSSSETSNAESTNTYPPSEEDVSEDTSSDKAEPTDTRSNYIPSSAEKPKRYASHAPRQSSLLRFARAMSSESPPQNTLRETVPFSPRSNITYRPRSETYSYDQSVMDEDDEDIDSSTKSPSTIQHTLEHLILDDQLLFENKSTRTSTGLVSDLRPEADAFTPAIIDPTQNIDMAALLNEENDGKDFGVPIASSPPEILESVADANRPSSPQSQQIPILERTNSVRHIQTPRQMHRDSHQYLDGSFTVYDDSLPATVQPQISADLDLGRRLYTHNPAYTAPPGRLRSGYPQSTFRYIPGDQSPTARAVLIRERRQREFLRSARIEGLRLDRARDQLGNTGDEHENAVIASEEMETNFWRDDLDADAVGDENFDVENLNEFSGRMRVVSGNRRLTHGM